MLPTAIFYRACQVDIYDAIYQAAHDFPGGVAALAARMGCSSNTLNHKVSTTNDTHHLTVAEFNKLLDFTGNYAPLHALNLQHHHVAHALPADTLGDDNLTQAAARACKEFGEFLTAVNSAVADHRVTTNERRRIERELGQMIAAAGQLLACVQSKTPAR